MGFDKAGASKECLQAICMKLYGRPYSNFSVEDLLQDFCMNLYKRSHSDYALEELLQDFGLKSERDAKETIHNFCMKTYGFPYCDYSSEELIIDIYMRHGFQYKEGSPQEIVSEIRALREVSVNEEVLLTTNKKELHKFLQKFLSVRSNLILWRICGIIEEKHFPLYLYYAWIFYTHPESHTVAMMQKFLKGYNESYKELIASEDADGRDAFEKKVVKWWNRTAAP
jgi:hypothetical protein